MAPVGAHVLEHHERRAVHAYVEVSVDTSMDPLQWGVPSRPLFTPYMYIYGKYIYIVSAN